MLHKTRPHRPTVLIALVVATVAAIAGSTTSALGNSQDTASAARALNATDVAHLHMVQNSGSAILEEGRASGALPGTIKVFLNVGATITAHFTIYVKGGGSVSGRGVGRLKGNSANPSYGGTMTVSHGTGRYAHAHGNGGFYGVLNRSTYALIVQTTGTLSY